MDCLQFPESSESDRQMLLSCIGSIAVVHWIVEFEYHLVAVIDGAV